MQNTTTATKPRSKLYDLYDKASKNWQSTIERLGYPAAYAQLITQGLNSFERENPLCVLDVGAGTGAFTSTFLRSQKAVKRVDLLEPSTKMLDAAENSICQTFSHVTPVLGGIGSTAIRVDAYDVVLCAHVVEHVDDVPSAFAWMRSSLRSGGVLLLAVSKPHWCTSLVRLRWGHSAYQPETVTKMLIDAGFSWVDTIPFKSGPPSRTSCGFAAYF